ncbi:MAG: hypothetical protein J0L72_08655 [Armatimonadetes bacterium]|nr:hypothetical protein [Armatimonadota bacterium]
MPVVTYAIDVYLPIPTQSSAFLNAAGVLALDHALGEELHMFRLAKATFYSAQNLNPNVMSMQEFVDFLEEHPGHGIWNEPRFRR